MISDVGGVDDASFNQTTWEGLERAGNELEDVTVQFLESQSQADYENNITEFAEQGYNMVITVGFLLGDATAKMAEVYPDLKFAIIDFAYDPPIPNVQGIVFNTDEAAFLGGYLAAGMAVEFDPAEPSVGYVGGMQIPPVEIFFVGFESGITYYNEQKGTDVQVSGTYVGDFEAPDEGKSAASSLLDEGVDVIFGVGGKTGNGALVAVRERAEAGDAVAGIGVDVDQYYTLPQEKGILLTSVEKRLDNAVFQTVEEAQAGNFGGGGVYVGTLANDGVGLAPYHDWEDEIPADLKAEIEEIRAELIAGNIDTGWPIGGEPEPEAQAFKVGMISDVGGVDDASFNQTTWEGLERAGNELEDVTVQFLESQSQADYENNITEFAEQGYNMVITVGFLLGDATAKMAEVYPDLKFAIIDFAYDPPIPNVQGIVFNTDEAAFLGGYLAAGMAVEFDPAEPSVGYVGGMQIPPVEIFFVGFESGITYYNEQKGTDVQVSGTYVGDFEAPDEGKSAASSLLDEGVDVIFGVGGKTGNGALVAVRERAEAGDAVAGIGVDVDQYYTLPQEKGILLTSVEKRLDNAVFQTVEEAQAGNFGGGGVYVGTLANDGVGLAPYHDWEDEIPDQIKADLEEIRAELIAGNINTGWPIGEEPEPQEPAEAGEVLKIGQLSMQSGVMSLYGIQQNRGFLLGLEYASGGEMDDEGRYIIAGRPVEVILRDTEGDPEKGVQLARELIESEGVELLQGPVSSAVAAALTTVAQENEIILMVDPAASAFTTGKYFNPYVFRTARTNYDDTLVIAKYLVENVGANFAHIGVDNAFGQGSGQALKYSVEKFGGEVIADIYAPFDTTDFTPYIQQAMDSGADCLFLTWAGTGYVTLFQQLSDLGALDEMRVATGYGDNASFAAVYGAAMDQIGLNVYHYTVPDNPINDWLTERHFEEYNEPPDLFTAGGMASALALAAALEETGGVTSGEMMIPALEGLMFDGPKGTYYIRPQDHVCEQPMNILKLVNLDPDQDGDGVLEYAFFETVYVSEYDELGVPCTLEGDYADRCGDLPTP